jgi:hypothetical protein
MDGKYCDLLQYITERVEQYETRYSLPLRGQAFMLWYGVEALGLEEDEAFVAVDSDGGNDKGIDLFHVDDGNERVIIAQGRFNARGNYNARPGALYELIHSTDFLQNPETLRRDGRPDLAELAADYLASVEQGYTVDFHFVYMGPPKQDVTDAQSQYNADFETSSGRFARVIDLELLQQIHDEYVDAASPSLRRRSASTRTPRSRRSAPSDARSSPPSRARS